MSRASRAALLPQLAPGARPADRPGRHVERARRSARRVRSAASRSRMSRRACAATISSMPWPEEEYRVAIDAQADLLFAPTELAAANLRAEGVPGAIFVTGNSGIDALLKVQRRACRRRSLRDTRPAPRCWSPATAGRIGTAASTRSLPRCIELAEERRVLDRRPAPPKPLMSRSGWNGCSAGGPASLWCRHAATASSSRGCAIAT